MTEARRTDRGRVLVAGVSVRAAAESAARAGYGVSGIDAFGDLDQHRSVRLISLGREFSSLSAACAAQAVDCDAVVYLANFENHPSAIANLAEGRVLWGNPPSTVRRVRDPLLLSAALAKRGIVTPKTHRPRSSEELRRLAEEGTRWLLKPLASGGGLRVRQWDGRSEIPQGSYLQELIDGMPGSILFAAAAGRACPLGVSAQLVGDSAFGAAGYKYCGNILAGASNDSSSPLSVDDGLLEKACAAARAAATEFDLVGVNGMDVVFAGRRPYPIEVNPRWCASMELIERAYGVSVFMVHADACQSGTLPEFDLFQARRDMPLAVGKAVVYARRDTPIGDSRAWLASSDVRDVPRPGEAISAGKPICTVFASARDGAACYLELVRRAGWVYEQVDGWARRVTTGPEGAS